MHCHSEWRFQFASTLENNDKRNTRCYEIAEVRAVYFTGFTQFITEDQANNGVNDSHKTNYIMISLIVLIHVD